MASQETKRYWLKKIADTLAIELGDPIQLDHIDTALAALDLGNIRLVVAEFVGDLYLSESSFHARFLQMSREHERPRARVVKIFERRRENYS